MPAFDTPRSVSQLFPRTRELLRLERALGATGQFPVSDSGSLSAETETFLTHFKDWDARKSLALLRERQSEPHHALRVLLFRGEFREADHLFEKLLEQGPEVAGPSGDPAIFAETLCEKSRLEAFRGNWSESDALATRTIGLEPVAQTRLAMYQVRALARFELGRLGEASQDLDQAEAIASILPHCPSSGYARILRAKITARDRGERGARAELDRIWTEIGGNETDLIHSLLRAEIDLARLSGHEHRELALAALEFARKLGERLYICLGLVDLFYASGERVQSGRGALARELLRAAVEFDRVGQLIVGAEGAEFSELARSPTVQAIRSWLERARPVSADDLRGFRGLPSRFLAGSR